MKKTKLIWIAELRIRFPIYEEEDFNLFKWFQEKYLNLKLWV